MIDMALSLLSTYLVRQKIHFSQDLAVGFLENSTVAEGTLFLEYVFVVTNAGKGFSFVTLVLEYFGGHMKRRKFNS